MSRKRSLLDPLPIFNQGKRQRQALLAHPNNHGEISHEAVRPKAQNFRKPYDSSSYDEKENSSPRFFKQTDPGNSVQRKGNFTLYQPVRRGSSQPPGNWQHGRTTPKYQEAREPHPEAMSNSFHPLKGSVNEPSRTSTGNAFFQAKEPAETASFDSRVVNQPEKSKPKKRELRILTSTAQGVAHWSQYKHITQLLFEVYGTLMTHCHEKCAQKFTLRTADGPLNCIFWEMDFKFPDIHQGHVVRVVGEWQPTDQIFKSYSVRLALKEEESTVEQCVKGADRQMRKMVGRL